MPARLVRERVKADAMDFAPVAFLHEPAPLCAEVHEAPAAERIRDRFPIPSCCVALVNWASGIRRPQTGQDEDAYSSILLVKLCVLSIKLTMSTTELELPPSLFIGSSLSLGQGAVPIDRATVQKQIYSTF